MSYNTILATAPLTTQNYHLKMIGTSIGNSLIWDNGTNVGIGNQGTTYTLDVSGTLRNTTSAYFATTSGSVGIGTTNTNNVKLEVSATTVGGAEYSAFTTNQDGGVASKYSFWRTYGGGSTAFRAAYIANYNQDDSNSSANDQRLVFATKSGTAEPTTKMTITGSGNVGINTSNPTGLSSRALVVTNTSDYPEVIVERLSSGAGKFGMLIGNSGDLLFRNYTAGTNPMIITSGGNVLVNTTSSLNGAKFEVLQNTNATNTITAHNNQASPYGLMVKYTAYSPNNSDNWFVTCEDSTTTRIKLQSNGGIGNYSGNNTNYSDIRLKDNIIPIESYWNKFKAIEIVKFKYKDQTHDDYYIGVIAQQVEEIAPEFVDLGEVNKTTPEDGIPIKSIYTEDLHHATIKVLQEAMTKIEELSQKVTELEKLVATK